MELHPTFFTFDELAADDALHSAEMKAHIAKLNEVEAADHRTYMRDEYFNSDEAALYRAYLD